MGKVNLKKIEERLDRINDLLLRLLVVQLYQNNFTMDQICKNLKISKPTVVEILKGLKKNKK